MPARFLPWLLVLSLLCACGEVDGPPPPCGGCLCVDPLWSCAETTEVRADGQAARLAPEVGFLELPLAVQYFEPDRERPGVLRPRIWYSFHPADERPEDKPVLLLFNGGPFAATFLAGIGTGPMLTYGERPVPNPASWTRFANLLYVDPAMAGFSYVIREPGRAVPEVYDHWLDADLFWRALLGFLARHEALRDNRVGLVGESYGGIRVTLMLEQLFAYERSERVSPELRAAFRDHVAAVFGGDARDVSPEVLAQQFAYQVLIQGVVGRLDSGRPCPGDQGGVAHDCSLTVEAYNAQAERINAAPADPRNWPGLFAHDLTAVAFMHPEARRGVDRGHGWPDHDAQMVARIGPLDEGDSYFEAYSGTGDRWWENEPQLVRAFVAHTRLVRTLVTAADDDWTVRTTDMPEWIAWARVPNVRSAEYDTAPRPGIARPGWLKITFEGEDEAEFTEEFRMPGYDAGHMVSIRAGEELAEDVKALLSE